VIGVVACTFTAAGLHLGKRLGAVFGKRMEIVGGVVLVAIGVKILLDHYRG
jgi:putative Mn2+ efflux pump MntP